MGSLSIAKLAIPTQHAQMTTGGGPHPTSPISYRDNWAWSQLVMAATVGPPPPLGAHIFIYRR